MKYSLWEEATGISSPCCKQDIQTGMFALLDANCLPDIPRRDRSSKTKKRAIVNRIWELFDADAARIAKAAESMLSAKAGIHYLEACARSNGHGEKANPAPSSAPAGAAAPAKKPLAYDQSWDKTYRAVFEHWTWKDKRMWPGRIWMEFCHYYPRPWDRKIYWHGCSLVLPAGKILIAERQIAEKHGITRDSLHRFLLKLEAEGMIKREQISCRRVIKKEDPVPAPVEDPVPAPVEDPVRKIGSWNVITLITICNYWKYHTKLDVAQDETGMAQDPVENPTPAPVEDPVPAPHRREYRNRENIETDTPLPPKNDNQQNISVDNPINAETLFDVWEKERGPLPTVEIRQKNIVEPLVEYLNRFRGDTPGPEKRWIQLIAIARESHPEHRSFINPQWMAKNLEHVNQLVAGLYRKSFREEKGRGKIRESGRGNPKEFSGSEGKEDARLDRYLAKAGSSDMPKV